VSCLFENFYALAAKVRRAIVICIWMDTN